MFREEAEREETDKIWQTEIQGITTDNKRTEFKEGSKVSAVKMLQKCDQSKNLSVYNEVGQKEYAD